MDDLYSRYVFKSMTDSNAECGVRANIAFDFVRIEAAKVAS